MNIITVEGGFCHPLPDLVHFLGHRCGEMSRIGTQFHAFRLSAVVAEASRSAEDFGTSIATQSEGGNS